MKARLKLSPRTVDGFLDEYAMAMDGGFLVVTRLGPIRSRLRKWRQMLWQFFGMLHPSDQPL